MDIKVKNADEHNLKNISVSIPMHQITGITGVSGSGKSTLLRDILAAKGAVNYSLIHTKTVRDSLRISDYVKVDAVDNLPQTIFIDVKSTVKNTVSTVSTISGVHELLRNLFTATGENHCHFCESETHDTLTSDTVLFADIVYDEKYLDIPAYICNRGKLINERFYNKSGKPARKNSIAFATIEFTLNKPNDNSIRRFNREFGTSIYIKNDEMSYNPLTTLLCSNCNQLIPRLTRSRLSFNTAYEEGGGACRCCQGSGIISSVDSEKLIVDINKPLLEGAVAFLSEKGIKYTTVTEVFIKAAAKHYGINIDRPLSELTEEQINILFQGGSDIISFKDRTGGKKSIPFKGIISYLENSYRSGKGKSALSNYFSDSICPECNGTRFDKLIDDFSVAGTSIRKVLSMNITDFGKWCRCTKENFPSGRKYFESLIVKCDHYEAVSCGHISLDRRSNSLSGGELQRLRLCSLLNSDIDNICYLLDEPSSGLHYSDIEKLGTLFRKICLSGNTIIIVEHNRKLLEYCDTIVDMGSTGGKTGGNILFSDSISNISKYNTSTVEYLLRPMESDTSDCESAENTSSASDSMMEFNNLTYNNLKNISVHIPYRKFTSVCGISGSGKTTFVKFAVYQNVSPDPSKYRFEDVYYFSQENLIGTYLSTIATQTQIMEHIAKLYAKASKLDKKNFMLGSKEGKCPKCAGKGVILSADNENLGMCSQCQGKRYSQDILSVAINGFNISQLMDMPVSELCSCIDDSKLSRLSEAFIKFDIGYLSLSRPIITLSKGEAQRLRLSSALTEKRKNTLFLLDEPAKGLHPKNIEALVSAINELIQLDNTVIAVEHEPMMIKKSDHIIEFGGTGTDGGYLLYEGNPSGIPETTPTGKMLYHHFSLSHNPVNEISLNNIIISDDNKNLSIPRFSCVCDIEDQELINSAVTWSNEKYLSVAIPNNIFFSKFHGDKVNINAPIVIQIDFLQPIRYDISLYAALNLKQLIIRKIQYLYPDMFELLKFVFDELSTTGKCSKCNGSGSISDIPRDYFLSEGDLSKSCIKFLNSSTQYKEIRKLLKTKYKIDISKKYSEMNECERNILFLGTNGNLPIDDDLPEWKGIIEQFLQYHKYYPESDSDVMFKKRKEIVCPICNGKRIQDKFIAYTVWNLNFGEIMSLSLHKIKEHIKNCDEQSALDNSIIDILEHMICLGLGNYTLSDTLLSMKTQEAQLTNLISRYTNNIYGTLIVIKNFSILNAEQQAYIRNLTEFWKITNTIIILD